MVCYSILARSGSSSIGSCGFIYKRLLLCSGRPKPISFIAGNSNEKKPLSVSVISPGRAQGDSN